jgi:Papain family cysteine protease
MKCRLALHGPMHVSLGIKGTSFMSYKSGIWDDPEQNCWRNRISDHAVALVGYGTELNQHGFETDYWIIQNSWGAKWGTNGFMKINRNYNLCRIGTEAMYPVLKTATPKPLAPIYTPKDCLVKEDVFSSTGVYIKSLCITDFSTNYYEDSRKSCLSRGMRLYQLDSTEAAASLLNALELKWPSKSDLLNIYVYGKNESVCANVNNKNPIGPVTTDFHW